MKATLLENIFEFIAAQSLILSRPHRTASRPESPRHTRVSHATDRSQYLRPRFQPGGLFCSTSARNEHPPFLCRDRQAILALTDFVRELFGPETSGNTWIFPG
jgi:hypothetical protein